VELIQHTPKLGTKIMLNRFFVHEIEGSAVRVIELEHPLQIVGLSIETDTKNVFRDVAQLGKRFEQIKAQIPNRQQPWIFAAVSRDFDRQSQTFRYMMGDVVTHIAAIPNGLETFTIPPGTYAVFPVRPKNKFGWGFAIGNAKRYAYNEWLPQFGYEPAGTIDDFEYHDTRSERDKNPEIDLYVAIKLKS